MPQNEYEKTYRERGMTQVLRTGHNYHIYEPFHGCKLTHPKFLGKASKADWYLHTTLGQ